MTDEKQLVSVGMSLDAAENPENYDWYVMRRGKPVKVKFYNDSCDLNERFWLFGQEFGPILLVCCYGGESNAYEIWLDELNPIPMDEIHEAYNAFDKLVEYMVGKGHENTRQLRNFCYRWCKFYFDVDTQNANYTGAWDRWELDESYQYQPNATDSGIVCVGHHEWMEEIQPDQVFFSPKG